MSKGGTDWKRVYDATRGIVMAKLVKIHAKIGLVDNPNSKLTHHQLDEVQYAHQLRQIERKKVRAARKLVVA